MWMYTHTHTYTGIHISSNWPLSLAEIIGRFFTTSSIRCQPLSSFLCVLFSSSLVLCHFTFFSCVSPTRWATASQAELYMTTRWRNSILTEVLCTTQLGLHILLPRVPSGQNVFTTVQEIQLSWLERGESVIVYDWDIRRRSKQWSCFCTTLHVTGINRASNM